MVHQVHLNLSISLQRGMIHYQLTKQVLKSIKTYSYILDEKVHDRSPIIRREIGHFNLCFSCVAYLNTSYDLVPIEATTEERAKIVVPGFHGLHLYANQFWIDHLRSYCTILNQLKKPLSHDLSSQLTAILGFVKESADVDYGSDHAPLDGFEILDQHSEIKALVYKVTKFRANLNMDDIGNKSDTSLAGTYPALLYMCHF